MWRDGSLFECVKCYLCFINVFLQPIHLIITINSANRLTLTNDYYIGKYEVTQALWKAVMGKNPSKI